MRNEKELFLEYCYMFRNSLADLQKYIEEEELEFGTLADIGVLYSFELANIGLELGYSAWCFDIVGNFDEIKSNFLSMIMENEKIVGCYNDEELKEIENRILNSKQN